MPCIGSKIRTGAIAGAVVAACSAVVPSVAAAMCPQSAAEGPLVQRYLSYDGDKNYYFAGPDGSFDNVALRWITAQGAVRTSSGDPTPRVGNAASAIALDPGAWVGSGEVCVDTTRPHFRFSARFLGGTAEARTVAPKPLRPSPASAFGGAPIAPATLGEVASPATARMIGTAVPQEKSAGKLYARVVQFTPSGARVTPAISLDATDFRMWKVTGFATLAPNVQLNLMGTAQVRLYFYAPKGNWAVDSVYVDPYRR